MLQSHAKMNKHPDTSMTPMKVYSRHEKTTGAGSAKGNSLEQLPIIFGSGFDPFNPDPEYGDVSG